MYYTPDELAEFTQEEYAEKLYCAKISMISTSLATDCFMNDHKRAVDVFNMAREAFVGACQLITLAIVLSNPGTALAGGAVLVNCCLAH